MTADLGTRVVSLVAVIGANASVDVDNERRRAAHALPIWHVLPLLIEAVLREQVAIVVQMLFSADGLVMGEGRSTSLDTRSAG